MPACAGKCRRHVAAGARAGRASADARSGRSGRWARPRALATPVAEATHHSSFVQEGLQLGSRGLAPGPAPTRALVARAGQRLKMDSPHPDVHALFRHYDALYFDGELGACSVEWSSDRMTRCAFLEAGPACCRGRHADPSGAPSRHSRRRCRRIAAVCTGGGRPDIQRSVAAILHTFSPRTVIDAFIQRLVAPRPGPRANSL